MVFKDSTGSLALFCSSTGRIEEVLSSIPGIEPEKDRPFVSIVDPESVQKALNMLQSLKSERVSDYWELNIRSAGMPKTLHFIGMVIESRILLAGSSSNDESERLLHELILINNEQTNTVRQALKQQVRSDQAFNELSIMNNEMANLQRSLQKANHELERLNILKNQVIGMAAHDIRGPIGSIAALSETLMGLLPEASSDVHLILSEIKKASEKIHIMVTDLLDVVKIETGKFELHLSDADLGEIISKSINNLSSSALKKESVFNYTENEEQIPARVDVNKIEQVMDNLLSNAIKYSPPGSVITIATKNLKQKVQVSVIDQGQGITSEDVGKLFQPFGRVGSTPTGGESSTGLGLRICRRIVEEHGGRIWVESEPGKGASFTFELNSRQTNLQ